MQRARWQKPQVYIFNFNLQLEVWPNIYKPISEIPEGLTNLIPFNQMFSFFCNHYYFSDWHCQPPSAQTRSHVHIFLYFTLLFPPAKHIQLIYVLPMHTPKQLLFHSFFLFLQIISYFEACHFSLVFLLFLCLFRV